MPTRARADHTGLQPVDLRRIVELHAQWLKQRTPQDKFDDELRQAKLEGKVTKKQRDALKARRRSRRNQG